MTTSYQNLAFHCA